MEGERKQDGAAYPAAAQSRAGGSRDGFDTDIKTNINAAKCTLKYLNKRRKYVVAACNDFTVH